jgi:hypothetical protein
MEILGILLQLPFWVGVLVGVVAGPHIKSLVSKFIKK